MWRWRVALARQAELRAAIGRAWHIEGAVPGLVDVGAEELEGLLDDLCDLYDLYEAREAAKPVTACDLGLDEKAEPTRYGAAVDATIAGWAAARLDIAPARRERVFRALYGGLLDGLCLDVVAMFRATEEDADGPEDRTP